MPVRTLRAVTLLLATWLALAGAARADDVPAAPMLRLDLGMHSATIRDAAVDRAGTLVVTASDDKTARVWTLPDLRPLRVLRPPIGTDDVGNVYAVAVSPDGTLAALGGWLTADKDRQVVDLFDLGSGRLVRQFQTSDITNSLAFSKDGQLLVAGLEVYGVRAWRLSDGTVQLQDRDYKDTVYGLDFAPDGRLAAASEDGDIRLYGAGLKLMQRRPADLGTWPFRVRFSPDGQDLAVGFNDRPVVEVRSGTDLTVQTRPDVTGLDNGSLSTVGWSADGQELLAGGKYGPQGGDSPVLAWRQRGAGPRQVASAGFADTVTAAIGLSGGALFTASGDPALGVFSGGKRAAAHTAPIANLRAWTDGDDPARALFRVSFDGSVVETDIIGRRGKPVHLDAAALAVTLADAPSPGLASWQTVEGDLRPRGWHNEKTPQLKQGVALPLNPDERSRAIDVRHGRVLLGAEWSLRLFDAAARQLWRHSAPDVAWRVAQSPDGRLAVAALGDGTVRWYRIADGQELLAIFLAADLRRWVAFTPTGYYAASPGGEDMIGWQVNNGSDHAADFFPASRFRDRFYRPDVVALVLRTLDEAAALRQADAARGLTARDVPTAPALQQEVLRDRPPVVSILSPRPGTELAGDAAALEVEVRSPGGRPITRVEARLDSRPAVGAQVGAPQAIDDPIPNERAERRHISVPVPAGKEASVQVIAWSDDRASEVATVQLRGRKQAEPTLPKPRLNAVLVGVSAYKDPDLRLKFAAKDAADLAKALREQKQLYGDINVREPLVDGQATKQAIEDALAELIKGGSRLDTTVVLLSGHGKSDGDSFYFFPVDADNSNFRSRGLTGGEIKDLLRQVNGHVLVFIDACYAGAFAGSKPVPDAPVDLSPLINALTSADSGLVVYGATRRGEKAQELVRLQHGAFTHALLEALHDKRAAAADGAIHVMTLAHFLSDEVPRLVPPEPPPGQHPSIGIPDGLGDPPVFMPQ